jgi:methylmalonyl-CoA mutase N-terminal domain/subunit
LALPTDKAARIALRTQQVIAHETGVANVVDPLGGSWLVEELTDRLEAEAEAMFAHIDVAGDGSMLEGAFRLIEEGWYQSAIADSAYEFEKKVNAGRRLIVSVNAFTEGNDSDRVELLRITQEDEQRQIKRLHEVKSDRNQAAVDEALVLLRRAAETDANLMPTLLETVESRATLGEIVDTLADVFGRYVEHPRI